MAARNPVVAGVVLFVVCAGLLLGGGWAMDYRSGHDGYAPVGTVYDVRDVHIGYEGGHSIIMVEYYYNNHIRTVDNKMHWEGRVNQIAIERTTGTDATLKWCSKNRQTHKRVYNCSYYPRNKYILYLPDTVKCSGVKSHTYRTDQEDHESWID